MRPQRIRRFLLSDAVALVAATALGLVGYRLWLSLDANDWGRLWDKSHLARAARMWIAAVESIPLMSILSLSWTVAVLLLRLRAPRPRRRHLWCQPGFLVCVAAVMVLVWKALVLGLNIAFELLMASPSQLSDAALQGYLSPTGFACEFVALLLSAHSAPQASIGGAVALVWILTWAAGRCRLEASWVDRVGRLLGAVWVFISLLSASAMFG